MDILALICFIAAIIIFLATAGVNTRRHVISSTNLGLAVLTLGIILNALALTGHNV